ncbi:epidermal growth factor-like protein 8 isoform X2 [Tachypleus tridentatus]|uniref:epidermal growth factor-like protein 8 isoform X2 n=1 Tax=Tachypleus tridentatus TaxID=6853 RepID=UPI003FCFE9E7
MMTNTKCWWIPLLLPLFFVFFWKSQASNYNNAIEKFHHQRSSSREKVISYRYQRNNNIVGRHVCVANKVVTKPVKHLELYCKPVYKTFVHLCDKTEFRFCSSYTIVYERAYRLVYKVISETQITYNCCPGWSRISPASHGCSKDVNECRQDEDFCEHQCLNTFGSYRCKCHDGFILQSDNKSCKLNMNRFPDQDFLRGYEELAKKVMNLEKIQEKHNITKLENQLEQLASIFSSIRRQSNVIVGSSNLKPHEIDYDSMYGSPWDRINSLSEQISLLEEKLEECTCKH